MALIRLVVLTWRTEMTTIAAFRVVRLTVTCEDKYRQGCISEEGG
jgi:hypothetical protein